MKSDTFATRTPTILIACIFIIIATQAKCSSCSIQTTFHAQRQLSHSNSQARINPTCILNCAQCVKIYGDYFDGYACAQTCKLFTPLKKSLREPVNYYYPWTKRGAGGVEVLDNDQDHYEEPDSEDDPSAYAYSSSVPKIDCTDITTIGRFIRN